MEGRMYWVDLVPTAVTAYTMDLLELKAATDKPIKVIAMNLHQVSDFGDAQDEVLSLTWVRGNTTSGSGGNTVTPAPCAIGDPAAAFAAESFNSTAASSGTAVFGPRHGWNVRAPLERPYTPDEQFTTAGAAYLVLRVVESPADSLTIAGSVCVCEMF